MNHQKTYYECQIERIARARGIQSYQYIQVRQSKAFMDRYLSEKIELKKLALSACMSRFHYIRVFRQVYGITPRQYLRDLRIAKAKELLRAGLSPTQACFDVGYTSLPTFSNAFKQGTGHSPKAWQQSAIAIRNK